MSGGSGPINFCLEFGWAAIKFYSPPGRPFAKMAGARAEFINSVSGGFGPINFCLEFGWAAIEFYSPPGRPFAKMAGAMAEFRNSVSGGLGPLGGDPLELK